MKRLKRLSILMILTMALSTPLWAVMCSCQYWQSGDYGILLMTPQGMDCFVQDCALKL